MVRDAEFLFALGAVGTQIVSAVVIAVVALYGIGVRGPATRLRNAVRGYELWIAASLAVAGTCVSLFFTAFADFSPGEVGWYTRICMYPLSITTVLAAFSADRRAARYLLAFPLVGMSLAVYGILLENGVVQQSKSCLLSGPGGCTTKWIDEFGYVTIPVMSLSSFFLIALLLLIVAVDRSEKPLWTLPRPLPIASMAVAVALVAVAAVSVAAVTTGSPSTPVTKVAARHTAHVADAQAGKALFISAGCSTCHTLAAAGANGKVATNLDQVKLPLALISTTVTNGNSAGMSPFSSILSSQQIADLSAFVFQAEHS